jgi:hypothetical protein
MGAWSPQSSAVIDKLVLVVTPVKTGVQSFHNYSKTLDSGFRLNDEML